MNLLLISILAVASLSLLPTKTLGTTEVQEPPQALPLAAQTQPTTSGGGGEIWQEDDREVLIRNERGTKNSGNGSGAGKRGKNKKNKNSVESSKVLPSSTSSTHTHEQQQQQKHQQPQQQQHELQQHKINEEHTHHKRTNKKNLKAKGEHTPSSCRYVKSPWTECDPKTNTRSRTLTLKKGEEACVPTRTIQKKCKKACRYEKGAWSECTTGQMSRTDKLKSTSDPTCQATRVVNKNCNPGKSKDKSNKDRKNKDKAARKGRA